MKSGDILDMTNYYRFIAKFSYDTVSFQISLYFSNNSSFIKMGIYLVSSKSLLYARILGRNVLKCLFWLNGGLFFDELSGCGFESCCCHLNLRYYTFFEQGDQATIECRFTLKCICDMIIA